jgi:hypothetical protein
MVGKPGGDDGALSPLYSRRRGWPTGGPTDAEIAHAAETRYRREMQALHERWQTGDLTAFLEALRLCRRHQQPLPDWFDDAGAALVEIAMAKKERHDRREWRIARTRWETVTELRERGEQLLRASKANLEYAKEQLKAATAARDTKKCECLEKLISKLVWIVPDDRGTSLERARVAASEALEGTDAQGKPLTIEDSFQLVEAAGGRAATFARYIEERRRRKSRRTSPD